MKLVLVNGQWRYRIEPDNPPACGTGMRTKFNGKPQADIDLYNFVQDLIKSGCLDEDRKNTAIELLKSARGFVYVS